MSSSHKIVADVLELLQPSVSVLIDQTSSIRRNGGRRLFFGAAKRKADPIAVGREGAHSLLVAVVSEGAFEGVWRRLPPPRSFVKMFSSSLLEPVQQSWLLRCWSCSRRCRVANVRRRACLVRRQVLQLSLGVGSFW